MPEHETVEHEYGWPSEDDSLTFPALDSGNDGLISDGVDVHQTSTELSPEEQAKEDALDEAWTNSRHYNPEGNRIDSRDPVTRRMAQIAVRDTSTKPEQIDVKRVA